MLNKKILKENVPFLDGIQKLLHGKCDYYILNNEREIVIEDAIFHYIDDDLQTRKSEIILSAIWINQKGTTYRKVTEKDIIKDLEEKLFLANLKNYLLQNTNIEMYENFEVEGEVYCFYGKNMLSSPDNSINVNIGEDVYCVEVIKEEYNHA